MTFRGKIENGIVVFEGDAPPDGASVEVQVTHWPADLTSEPAREKPTVWEKLLALKGAAPDLPADAARNHDHYLYGTPKR